MLNPLAEGGLKTLCVMSEVSAGLLRALDLCLQASEVPARVCAQASDLGLQVPEAGQCLRIGALTRVAAS